jgi:hypothetical protein
MARGFAVQKSYNTLTKILLQMNKNQPVGQLTLSLLIERHRINKAHLASKMNMPQGTFNNKLSEKQTAYRFTEVEEQALIAILRDMADDIKIVAGIGFNKALATIVNK